MFGVSDNAIRKWCKSYNISNFPNNKFRLKEFYKSKVVSLSEIESESNA